MSLGHPGADGVNAKVVLVRVDKIGTQRAHQALHTVLGCLVNRHSRGLLEPCGAREKSDGAIHTRATVVAEVGASETNDVESSSEVDVEVSGGWGLIIVSKITQEVGAVGSLPRAQPEGLEHCQTNSPLVPYCQQ